MKIDPLALLCLAVLCTILTLGLWPFHSPRNEVSWLAHANGLRFGTYGTVFGSRPFFAISAPEGLEVTVEIWLQPRRTWDSGTFLTFHLPGRSSEFSLRQSQTDLLVKAGRREDESHSKAAYFYVRGAFRRGGPAFITVTSDGQALRVYLNGVLALPRTPLRISANVLTGRLILGDSTGQPDSWSGEMFGLAIYRGPQVSGKVHCRRR